MAQPLSIPFGCVRVKLVIVATVPQPDVMLAHHVFQQDIVDNSTSSHLELPPAAEDVGMDLVRDAPTTNGQTRSHFVKTGSFGYCE